MNEFLTAVQSMNSDLGADVTEDSLVQRVADIKALLVRTDAEGVDEVPHLTNMCDVFTGKLKALQKQNAANVKGK